MAKVNAALQTQMEAKNVHTKAKLKDVNRRELIEWDVYEATTKTYITIKASVERMNRRAADGLGFNVVDMAKVERPRKGVTATKPATTKTKTKAAPLKAKLAEPLPKPAEPTPTARVIFLVDRSPSMLYPASLPNSKIPQMFNSSDPLLSLPGVKRHELVNKQIDAIAASLSPDFLIDVYDFDISPRMTAQNVRADRFKIGKHPQSSSGTGIYTALNTGLYAANNYAAAGHPVLLYLLTDGDNNGPVVDVSSQLKRLLDTGKATIAAIGPRSALDFLIPLGVPKGCIKDWQGEGEALNAATQQAQRGAEQFTDAVKQKKSTSLKSFFVDVVATGLTLATLKRECREITTAMLRRKIGKYEICKPFVEETLKRSYVPGAAYYQLQKAETLKDGRRIIVQPRDVDSFYAGPKARVLLGLPEKGDCRIEPKNLGDFIVYVQSAAENRKLVPGTIFLYDLTHVDGATSPTWSR